MNAREAYLADVLTNAPRARLEHLFRVRRHYLKTSAATKESAAQAFIPSEQIEAILSKVEAKLFTAPIEENDAELLALAGKTEVHTRWWKRLRVANESRPALERLARKSPQWEGILTRLQRIVATPQGEREEARNRFLAEVSPILARPTGAMRNNVYHLHQAYGGRAVFEALMSRLIMDVPAFHALESIYFANFNPDASSGLVGMRTSTNAPRTRYCPLPAERVPTGPLALRVVTIALYVGTLVFWIKVFVP